jgi:hypothetical protein
MYSISLVEFVLLIWAFIGFNCIIFWGISLSSLISKFEHFLEMMALGIYNIPHESMIFGLHKWHAKVSIIIDLDSYHVGTLEQIVNLL